MRWENALAGRSSAWSVLMGNFKRNAGKSDIVSQSPPAHNKTQLEKPNGNYRTQPIYEW